MKELHIGYSPHSFSEFVVSASDLEQLDVKHERGAARNHAACPTVTISQVRRDCQFALLANAHVQEALKTNVSLHLLELFGFPFYYSTIVRICIPAGYSR